MAKKKQDGTPDNGAEEQQEQPGHAGESQMMLVVSLGVTGDAKAETLLRIIQASLGNLSVDEAGKQLMAFYAGLGTAEQRAFVRDVDFIVGRVVSVTKLLPERVIVK